LAYARDVTEALPASLLLAANGAVSLGPEHRGIPHGGAMTNRTMNRYERLRAGKVAA